MNWLYENIDADNFETIRVLITAGALLIGAAAFFIFYWIVRAMARRVILRQLEEEANKPKCEHEFKFIDPEIMEHEPFCYKCERWLNEVIERGE